MPRRSPEEIEAFAEKVRGAVPKGKVNAVSIHDIGTTLRLISSRRSWTTQAKRRVHEALAALHEVGEIKVSGQGRATRYYR